MTNIQNSTQFAITLNPKTEAVEFSILDYEGKLQTLSFKNAEVRDETIECKNASVVCFFCHRFQDSCMQLTIYYSALLIAYDDKMFTATSTRK
jgi:hypothetical protein